MTKQAISLLIITILITACANNPYNKFESDPRIVTNEGLKIQLHTAGIRVVEYGDTTTLFVPTDRFFVFDAAELDKFQYDSLLHVMKFLHQYPDAEITVAGFTDDVGSDQHKAQLSEHRARAMLAFIWSHGIEAHRLRAEGYGDRFDIADNAKVEGSTLNRRLEIQIIRRV